LQVRVLPGPPHSTFADVRRDPPGRADVLTGKKDSKSATITAGLRIPGLEMTGNLLWFCFTDLAVASGFVDDWARELNSLGIAAFILDSVTQDRGLTRHEAKG
jgi:hypothetical protein